MDPKFKNESGMEKLLVLTLATQLHELVPSKSLQRPTHLYNIFCYLFPDAKVVPEKDAADRVRRLLVREGLHASDSPIRDGSPPLLQDKLRASALAVELASVFCAEQLLGSQSKMLCTSQHS